MRLSTPLILLLLTSLPAAADLAVIEAARDATLIEDPAGALANGSGDGLFAGRTGQDVGGVRRALLWFGVAAALPRRAIVESVELTSFVWPSNPAPTELRLHRVQAPWSEGPSASSGGGGRPSQPGDVTWLHTRFDRELWVRPGGQFIGRASAVTTIAGSGLYVWTDPVHMVQDVRLWLRNPRRNAGWILVGDETAPQTVKRLASREQPDPALRPTLRITYRVPGRN